VTSKPGGTPVDRVAADTNVLLSAVLGHAALKVFTEYDVAVVSPSGVVEEVRDYLPEVGEQDDISVEALESQLRLLAIREYEREAYEEKLIEARSRIGARDPDDIDLLALALVLEIPVWSNDSDFKGAGVEWYTTARLLKLLAKRRL
jgi:predicted nucleic acid-binding protein